jgi:hypothetical protein
VNDGHELALAVSRTGFAMSSKLTSNRRGGLRDFPGGGYQEWSLLIPLELHDPSARGGTM